jgi:hypothetical protein
MHACMHACTQCDTQAAHAVCMHAYIYECMHARIRLQAPTQHPTHCMRAMRRGTHAVRVPGPHTPLIYIHAYARPYTHCACQALTAGRARPTEPSGSATTGHRGLWPVIARRGGRGRLPYVCMYVCMYAYTYIHTGLYIHTYAYIHTHCMHVSMYACVCLYTHIYAYTCMYARMHVSMYACMHAQRRRATAAWKLQVKSHRISMISAFAPATRPRRRHSRGSSASAHKSQP